MATVRLGSLTYLTSSFWFLAMAQDNTISNFITDVAQSAASVTTDGTSVSERSLSELIEADKYLSGKRAASNPTAGLRLTQLVTGPGGR